MKVPPKKKAGPKRPARLPVVLAPQVNCAPVVAALAPVLREAATGAPAPPTCGGVPDDAGLPPEAGYHEGVCACGA